MSKKIDIPDKKDPPPLTKISKQALMQMTSRHAKRALEITVELMESADNDSVRLGAAKSIINKCLPDLKAVEVEGDVGVKIQYVVELPVEEDLEAPPIKIESK